MSNLVGPHFREQQSRLLQALVGLEEPRREEMLVMEALIEHDGMDVWALISARFAPIPGVVRRAFGCWHLQMSLSIYPRQRDLSDVCKLRGSSSVRFEPVGHGW
jgi:hypothetical protein